MQSAKKIATGFVLVAAVLQWALIGERSFAALWAWYKFSAPYKGGGYITVRLSSQGIFYTASAILVIIAIWASSQSGRWKIVARSSLMFIVVGMLLWSALLLSPLVAFRR